MAPDRSLTAKIQHEMNFVEADPNSKKYKYTPLDTYSPANSAVKAKSWLIFLIQIIWTELVQNTISHKCQ